MGERSGRYGLERITKAIVELLRRVREQVIDSAQQHAQALG
jgi:hypothetical protein